MAVLKRVHQLETSHQPTTLTGDMFLSLSLIKGIISKDCCFLMSINLIGNICMCEQTLHTNGE